MEYLDDSKNLTSPTISDLNNVLGFLQGNFLCQEKNKRFIFYF